MFGKFDKVVKLNALLHDPKFEMIVINLKKIFEDFFARFTLVIALLDLINLYKISNLWQISSKYF